MQTTPLFAAALEYARQGWHVFPLGVKGKKPIMKGGFYKATTDEATIKQWIRQYPNANIGLATGVKSGVFVVDIDGNVGEADLARLQDQYGMLPETLQSTTGAGGHLYFKFPVHAMVKNRAKIISHEKGVEGGLDTRGEGGYVVLPPSIHPSNKVYQWANNAPIVECPEWLLNLIVKSSKLVDDTSNVIPEDFGGDEAPDISESDISFYETGLPDADIEQHTKTITPTQSTKSQNDFARLLAKVCNAVRSANEGKRNDTLNRAAYTLGGLMVALRGNEEQARAELLAAGLAAGLEHDECIETIESGMTSGLEAPMTPKAQPYPTNGTKHDPSRLLEIPDDTHDDSIKIDVSRVESFLTDLPLTDYGNGEVFAALHAEKAKFDATSNVWRIWDGTRWVEDKRMETGRLMISAIRQRRDAFNNMATATDEEAKIKKAGWQFALSCENYPKAQSALKSAMMNEDIVTIPTDYDKHKNIACAGEYTLDLEQCIARQSERKDMLTLKMGATFDKDADCPRWKRFISEVFPNDDELQRYIQRVAGYCLTGETKEQCFFILHGAGANGKSTFLNVLADVLGEYHTSIAARVLVGGKNDNEPQWALAQCKGSRLLTMSETNEGMKLDEGLTKIATGEDEIQCRVMRGMPFRYYPQFKLMLALNHLPRITGTDEGIWRRIHLIPFTESFKNRKDPNLKAVLYSEMSGILNWMLEGLVEWRKDGLNPPDIVKATTQAYRDDSDTFGQWVSECIQITNDSSDMLGSSVTYNAYVRWATGMNIRSPLSLVAWGRRIETQLRKTRTAQGIYYTGAKYIGN